MRNRSVRLALAGVLCAGLVVSQSSCARTAAGAESTAPATCTDDDVQVDVTLQPPTGSGTAVRGLLALTNASDRACVVEGRASVSLTNAADEVVPVPTEEVDQPGAAVRIRLEPGVTAFEGLKWTPCDKGSPTCGAGNGLRFSLQASADGPAVTLSGFPAPEKSAITMASLQVGTLQPSHQGVVAW